MYFLGVIVAILWAAYPFIIKDIKVSPLVSWAIMTIIAAVFAIVLLLSMKPTLPSPKDASPIIVAGLMGPVCGTLLFLYTLSIAPSTTMAVTIAYTVPLFAMLIGFFIYKEMITFKQLVGGLCILLGIIVVTSDKK